MQQGRVSTPLSKHINHIPSSWHHNLPASFSCSSQKATHIHIHTHLYAILGACTAIICSILSHLQIRSILLLLTFQEPINIYHCKSNLASVKYICFEWSILPDNFLPEIKTISAKTTWPKSQEAIEPESIAAWSPNKENPKEFIYALVCFCWYGWNQTAGPLMSFSSLEHYFLDKLNRVYAL